MEALSVDSPLLPIKNLSILTPIVIVIVIVVGMVILKLMFGRKRQFVVSISKIEEASSHESAF
jgi:hypothetical protein